MTNLLEKLDVLKLATTSRVIQPILNNVAFNDDYMYTTDLDISIKVPFLSGVRTTVDLKRFQQTVKANKGKHFKLESEDSVGTLRIDYNKRKYDLRSLPYDEMPSRNFKHNTDKMLKLTTDEFKNVVEKVLPFCASYDAHNVLGGVCIASDEWAATDGSRLGVLKLKGLKDNQYVLNGDGVRAIAKVVNKIKHKDYIVFSFPELDNNDTHQYAVVSVGDYTISIPIIKGQYPKYNQLIPRQNKHKYIFDRKELTEGINGIKHLANERTNIITINPQSEVDIQIATNTPDVGDAMAIVSCENRGELLEGQSGINYKYLLEGLKAIDGDDIQWETNGILSPFLFTNGNDDYIHLIMPVQIK